MSLVYVGPEYLVQPGDLVVRRKHSGLGWHFGTGLSGGMVKETTPETGKRITTFQDFCSGQQGFVVRPNRSPYENALVEERALSDLVSTYDGLRDNCEHDSSFAQTGVASSPTANGLLLVGGLSALALLAHKFGNTR